MKRAARLGGLVLLTCFCLVGVVAAQGSAKIPFGDDDSLEVLQAKIKANGYNFTVKHNWVYDMAPEEKKAFLSRRRGAYPTPAKVSDDGGPLKDILGKVSLPTHFDWRDYNGHTYIGPIRDQGGCGSCYSFGANAAAEGVYNYANGLYDANCADFSESFIIWCLGRLPEFNDHFYGCSGADYTYSELQALVDYGVCTESAFPYQQNDPGSCTHWGDPLTRFSGWYRVPCGDVAAIKTAIMTYGVVDAAVYAGGAFQAYGGGIYEDTNTACYSSPCWDTPTNHAIGLVGWDDAEGVFYLRNSWGSTSWGEGGYMRIKYTSAIVACEVCYLVYDQNPGCTYQMGAASTSLGWTGGNQNFSVTAGSGCTWSAMSNNDWIQITSGNSGSGNGTVRFAVSSNNDPAPRAGSIRFNAGLQTVIHDVYQEGAPPVPPAVTAQSPSQEAVLGQTLTLSVTAQGTNPLTYQWYTGPVGDTAHPVDGALSSTLKVKALNTTIYWARVTNEYGHADSAAIVLTVNRRYAVAHISGQTGWWTQLSLVNVADLPGALKFEAFNAAGELVEEKNLSRLNAGEQFTLDAATFFSPTTLSQDFWVQVTSSAVLKGVLEFGASDRQACVSLPLDETTGDKNLMFPYVFVAPGQAESFYTGLTLINPSAETAHVVLEGCSDMGEKLVSRELLFPPRGKMVRLVEQFFEGFENVGSIRYVRVVSDVALNGFELFGKLGDQGLSGLPAVLLSPANREGGEAAAGDLERLYFSVIPNDRAWYTGVTFTNLDAEGNTCTLEVRDHSGNILAFSYLGLWGKQQMAREVWSVLGGLLPEACWFKLEGIRRMAGFSLFLSRSAPFAFDGLMANSRGYTRLCFPKAGLQENSTSLLNLANVGADPAAIVIRAMTAKGVEKTVKNVLLNPGAAMHSPISDLFPGETQDVAWVKVDSSQALLGSLWTLNLDWSTLGCYPAREIE